MKLNLKTEAAVKDFFNLLDGVFYALESLEHIYGNEDGVGFVVRKVYNETVRLQAPALEEATRLFTEKGLSAEAYRETLLMKRKPMRKSPLPRPTL